MTDLLLAPASLVGALAYATVGIAVYKLGVQRGDARWHQRLGGALTCVGLYMGAIVVTASAVLMHRDGGWMVLTVGGGFVLLIYPFVNAVAYDVTVGGYDDTGEWANGHVARALFWPLALPLTWLVRVVAVLIMAFCAAAVFCARGPIGWGEWLAGIPTRRERRRAEMQRELATRAARIAELEKELGL